MPAPNAATAAEIRAILGPLDEAVLTDILRIGATAAEVQEAFTRLEGDDAVGKVAQRGASARVAALMDVLEAAELPREDGG